MHKALALSVMVLLATTAGLEAETLKLAVPQKGAWDTSFCSYGVRQGFFKDEGIDLAITYTEGGATTETAVVSGSVDLAVATGTLGILSAYVKGAPVRIISAESTGSADLYWYAKAGSGIKSLKDLKGKTIAFSAPGSSSNLSLLTLLKEQGVAAKPTPAGGMPATFTQVMSGQLDAGWAAAPFGVKDIQDGKIVVVARANDSPSVRTETIRVNVVNLNTLKQKRDAIVHFMKAYYKSYQWAYSDPKAMDYLAEDNNIPHAIAETTVKQFMTKQANDPYHISGIQRVLDEAYAAKRLAKPMKEDEVKGAFDIVWKPGS
ncbi:MAG TPA: ABC transporter substrate-binding protein [Stellaceae bacterium]|jgi:NitT/TauT family transport system substrate-binding protein|nr:ABC transporter substrate-binding protein [Stellaceae bacterium]